MCKHNNYRCYTQSDLNIKISSGNINLFFYKCILTFHVKINYKLIYISVLTYENNWQYWCFNKSINTANAPTGHEQRRGDSREDSEICMPPTSGFNVSFEISYYSSIHLNFSLLRSSINDIRYYNGQNIDGHTTMTSLENH